MYHQALMDLEKADALKYNVDNIADFLPIEPSGGPPSLQAIRALACTIENNPGIAPRPTDMTNAFLVAEQPGLSSIFDANGITQHYAFKASSSDPDTLSYDEAMADKDRDKWIEAAKKEILSLEHEGTWTEVDISEATSRILPSQWVFHRKRTPDGNIKSYKARSVCQGDLEQGVFDTFAPVVAWCTVRFCLDGTHAR
jgi:hypothetical protein